MKLLIEGILLEKLRKGVWNVQFGSVKMTVKEKDMTLISSAASLTLSKFFFSTRKNLYFFICSYWHTRINILQKTRTTKE